MSVSREAVKRQLAELGYHDCPEDVVDEFLAELQAELDRARKSAAPPAEILAPKQCVHDHPPLHSSHLPPPQEEASARGAGASSQRAKGTSPLALWAELILLGVVEQVSCKEAREPSPCKIQCGPGAGQ